MGLFLLTMTTTTLPIISAFTSSATTSRQTRHLDRRVPLTQHSNCYRNDQRNSKILSASQQDDDEFDDDDDDDDEEEMPPIIAGFELDEDDDNDLSTFTAEELQSMTVPQLKQQLRLRGKKVSGNKSDLIARLLEKRSEISMDSTSDVGEGYSKFQKPYTPSSSSSSSSQTNGEESGEKQQQSKRVMEAKARGAEIVDVTEYLDDESEWKTNFRSSDRKKKSINDIDDDTIDVEAKDPDNEDTSSSSSSTEVWGDDAKIVEDYEGRSIVVDGLSRTVIEYKGSNNTIVQAYVVGSREALKKFLRGGTSTDGNGEQQQQPTEDESKTVYSSMEEEVLAIQRKREVESKRGLIRPDEVEGVEDRSDPGTQYQHIERDYGDWGVYTPTGAQLSAAEVQGVLLLSDVYGPFTDNTQALADKIAYECQPVVVFVPDMFRGDPWTMDPVVDEVDGVARNEKGKSYEEWRAGHPERRVDVDIRAAAAVLREKYAVSSIAVWGTCYGGGRALEAAAGWYEGGASSYYEDAFSDRRAPPHVDPIACISWYPTRYDATRLFGANNEGFRTFESGEDRKVAVMAVFAENDDLAGATPEDAAVLRSRLENDPRVVDFMVKVFPGQKHGFAHNHLGQPEEGSDDSDRFIDEGFGGADPLTIGGDAEVACLLSTAWMETYTRVFLPTVGTPVRYEEENSWSSTLESNYQAEQRGIREELEQAINTYEDVTPDLGRMSQTRSPLLDGEANEAYDRIEEEREKIKQEILTKYGISPDDDDETFNAKFAKAMADGALDRLLIDAYMDDSNDAYW